MTARVLLPEELPQPLSLDDFIRESEPYFRPPPPRPELRVDAWLQRDLPPRDYLLGELLCTTSRWLVIGETGVGKTLFSLEMAGAIAAGASFLGWQGRRRARVIYLDGELPAETLKERIGLVADRFGTDIELFVYNRDIIGQDDMPALNSEAGAKWLWREIETVKPDAIFFDSIMCLLTGAMSDEESWAPVKGMIRQISGQRIAQVWLHHTGHDSTKGFGTKTREWEMDTVVMLSKANEEGDAALGAAFQVEFRKARLKTPANFHHFATKTVRRDESGFTFDETITTAAPRQNSDVATIRQQFIAAYERLADDIEPSPGFDGAAVRKVGADAIRDELKSRGYLDTTDKGRLTSTSRSHLRRAKTHLLNEGRFVEEAGLVWRIRH